jgi:chondroitin 4-sulfotransferase 11
MISHQHRFIFVHSSRVGGSSIERLAGVNVTKDPRTAHTGNTDFPEKHAGFEYYRRRYPVYFDQYFKFTVVRNPYDRLISAWLWINMVSKGSSTISLTQFILSRPPAFALSNFLRLDAMTLAESVDVFDFVARFETLGQDIKHMCGQTGMDDRLLPHTNKTEKADYREYYSPSDRLAAEKLLAEDAEFFGYTF